MMVQYFRIGILFLPKRKKLPVTERSVTSEKYNGRFLWSTF